MPEEKKDKKEAAANKLLKVLRDRDTQSEPEETRPPEREASEVAVESPQEDDAEELIGIGGPVPMEEEVTRETARGVRTRGEAAEEDVSVGSPSSERIASLTEKQGRSGLIHELTRYVYRDKVVTGALVDGTRIAFASVEDQRGVKRLVDFTVTQIDPDQASGDPEEKQRLIAEICRELLTEKRGKRKSFFTLKEELSLPGKIVSCFPEAGPVVKDVELPDVSKKELADAIEWNAKKDLPFDEGNLIIDHMNQTGNGDRGAAGGHHLVGVGSEESINESLQVLASSVGIPRKFAPAAYAAWSAYTWNYPDFLKDDAIVVHIGETKTVILFISGPVLRFVRDVQIGGADFSKAIPNEITVKGERISVTPRVAEKLRQEFKIPMGESPASEEDEAKNAQLMPHFRNTLERFVGSVNRALNVHRKEFPINGVKRIFLTGSGAALGNFPQYLSEALGKKVLHLDPVRMVLGQELIEEKNGDPSNRLTLGVPLGLALNLHKGLNLLPKKLRREELFMMANHIGRKAMIPLFVFFFALTGMTKLDLEGTKTQLVIQETIKAQLVPIKLRYDNLIKELTDMQDHGGMVNSDREYHELEVAILKLFSNVTPKEIFLTYLGFQKGWDVTKNKRVGRATTTETEVQDPDQHFIRVEGMAATNPALQEAFLANYVATLNSHGLFSDISIVNKRQEEKQGVKGLAFELKCQL